MSSNYQNIDRPYDNNVSRDTSESTTGTESTIIGGGDSASTSGGSSSSEQGSSEKSTTGTDLTDIYLKTWIKSRGYTPKTTGFLLDGAGGYIECMQLYVGTGGIVGGKLDIPDASTTNSFHVDANGNIWSGATSDNLATAPFSVANTGTIKATLGTIGGWALTSNSIYYNGSGTPSIKTAATVGAGSTGVILDSAGLRGYDSVLGKTFDLPVDGSAPSFASGVITETTFEINTNAVLRTSATVGDGTASSAGILINNTGFYACQASQTLANANVKILTTGAATFAGTLNAATGTFAGSLTAATGTLGALTIDSGGNIKSGKTTYADNTAGFYFGNDSSTPVFSIGDATNYLKWSGAGLSLSGSLTAGTGSTISADYLTAGSITSKAINLTVTEGGGDSYIAAGKTYFESTKFLGDSTSQFDITKDGDIVTFTYDGTGTNPNIETNIAIGDIVFFSSPSLDPTDCGIFTVTGVGTSYFTTTNDAWGGGGSNITIGDGKFEVTKNGFIIGIDDSDSNTAKLTIGGLEKYVSWDGDTFYIKGSLETTDFRWTTVFEGLGGILHGGTGSETITASTDGLYFLTDANTNDTAYVYKDIVNFNGLFSWDKNRKIRFGLKMAQKTAQEIYIWIGGSSTSSTRKIGFKIENDDLYGICADGTTTSSTLINGALDETLSYLLEVRFYVGSRCEFYVNNVFKAMLLTNLPAGTSDSEMIIRAQIKTTENATKSMIIPFWDFWQAY